MAGVPILCYHHIAKPPPDARFAMLYVTPARFERQLRMLRALGFRGVSVGEGLRRLDRTADERCVILTFDDGYVETLRTAAPLLRKYGCSATCYIVSDFIGGHNAWDRDEHRRESRRLMDRGELAAWLEQGFEIGAHSRTHPRLDLLDEAAAYAEIADSRTALEASLGATVEHFCYPFGRYNAATVELVRKAGYKSAVTTEAGIAARGRDPFRLPRQLVQGNRGAWRFMLQVAAPLASLRFRRTAHSQPGSDASASGRRDSA